MKTMVDLNSKWWYRLLKVVYVCFFAYVALGFISEIFHYNKPYSTLDETRSEVVCLKGNKETYTYSRLINLYSVNSLVLETQGLSSTRIASLCDILDPFGDEVELNGSII